MAFVKGKNNETLWQPRFSPYSDGDQPGKTNDNEKSTPQEIVAAHGPAKELHIKFDHAGDRHMLSSGHEDGHKHESVHSSAAEALEHGGILANTDVKRREHSDQQGAQSEEDGFEMPDLA